MENMDKEKELEEISAKSAGAAQAKYANYLDSIEATTKRIQNAWEKLVLAFKENEWVKKFYQALALMIEHLPTIIDAASKFVTIPMMYKLVGKAGNGGLFGIMAHSKDEFTGKHRWWQARKADLQDSKLVGGKNALEEYADPTKWRGTITSKFDDVIKYLEQMANPDKAKTGDQSNQGKQEGQDKQNTQTQNQDQKKAQENSSQDNNVDQNNKPTSNQENESQENESTTEQKQEPKSTAQTRDERAEKVAKIKEDSEKEKSAIDDKLKKQLNAVDAKKAKDLEGISAKYNKNITNAETEVKNAEASIEIRKAEIYKKAAIRKGQIALDADEAKRRVDDKYQIKEEEYIEGITEAEKEARQKVRDFELGSTGTANRTYTTYEKIGERSVGLVGEYVTSRGNAHKVHFDENLGKWVEEDRLDANGNPIVHEGDKRIRNRHEQFEDIIDTNPTTHTDANVSVVKKGDKWYYADTGKRVSKKDLQTLVTNKDIADKNESNATLEKKTIAAIANNKKAKVDEEAKSDIKALEKELDDAKSNLEEQSDNKKEKIQNIEKQAQDEKSKLVAEANLQKRKIDDQIDAEIQEVNNEAANEKHEADLERAKAQAVESDKQIKLKEKEKKKEEKAQEKAQEKQQALEDKYLTEEDKKNLTEEQKTKKIADEKKKARKVKQQKVGAAAVSAVSTGITAYSTLTDEDGHEASTTAKAFTAGVSGALTGVLTYFAGPLGGAIGSALVTPIGKFFTNIIDSEDLARREAAERAAKAYSTLKAINEDTETLKDLSESNSLSYSDYQTATASIENIKTQLMSSKEASQIFLEEYGINTDNMSSWDITKEIESKLDSYLTADSNTREQLMNDWTAALTKAEAKTYEQSQTENIYQYNKTISDSDTGSRALTAGVWGKGVKSTVDDFIENNPELFVGTRKGTRIEYSGDTEQRLETQEKLLAYLEDNDMEESSLYTSLQKSINNLNNAINNLDSTIDDINNARVEAATNELKFNEDDSDAESFNLNDLTTDQIKELGMDKIAEMLLTAINENGGFYVNESLTDYKAVWSGSLETQDTLSKQYLTSALKGNEKIYNALTGNSYTLQEVLNGKLGNIITKDGSIDFSKTDLEAATYLTSFAHSLNMTTDELIALTNTDAHMELTLSDVIASTTELTSEIDSLATITGELISGDGLSVELIKKILEEEEYTQFLKYAGNTQELFKQLTNKMLLDEETIVEQTKSALFSNTGLYGQLKNSINEQYSEDSDFGQFFSKKFGNVNNLDDFLITKKSLTDEELVEYEEQLSNVDQMIYEIFGTEYKIQLNTTTLDYVNQYLTEMYQKQIDNLNAQKDAIADINSQREYEIKLIEARQKLENLQNEKKRVYRAGVGFVYEADQEAIQEQQEVVDELENQKITDALQMQIDELESQKTYLEEFPDRKQFKQLQSAFEAVKDTNAGLQDVGNNLNTAVYRLIQAYNQQGYFEMSDFVEERNEINEENIEAAKGSLSQSAETFNTALQDYSAVEKFYNEGSNDDTIAALKQVAEKNSDSTSAELLKYINNDEDSIYNGKTMGEAAAEAMRTASSRVASTGKTVTTTADTLESYGASDEVSSVLQNSALNNAVSDTGMLDTSGEKKNIDINRINEIIEQTNIDNEAGGAKMNIPETQVEDLREKAFQSTVDKIEEELGYNNDDQNEQYYISYTYEKDGKTYAGSFLTPINSNWSEDELTEEINERFSNKVKSENLDNAIITNWDAIKDKNNRYIYATSGAGGFTSANAIAKIIKEVLPDVLGEYNYNDLNSYIYSGKHKDLKKQLQKAYINVLEGGDMTGEGISNTVDKVALHEYFEMLFNDTNFLPRYGENKAGSFYTGSLYTSQGLANISERGTELFTTPSLSGTALIPEGSKVIPAEATAGLWKLGSLANEFIQPLKSLSHEYSTTANTYGGVDNSMDIQTLNISMRADKDFDIDTFIQELRSVYALTKHNH